MMLSKFNSINMKKKNTIILVSIFSIISFGLYIYFYRYYCHYNTFKKINDKFEQKESWEKELEIYSISMPKFYTSGLKKPKCILLIGGYKDIPYVWEEFEKYLIKDKIDFYAPRTCGNGRSFYQIVDWKDWVLTYMEAMYILQEQYKTVDIIGFSTGAVIAVYLTQFKFKCDVNNLFLCAPFLTNKKYLSIDIIFGSNIVSKIFNKLFVWTFRFRPKSTGKFKGYRDTYNEFYSINDYCEIFGDVLMETVLFDFIKFRPSEMYVSNVVFLYPNDDTIIGDIGEQKNIISKVFTKKIIDVIQIPSYLNYSEQNEKNEKNLPSKSGHLMFKEKPEIIQDIYLNIQKYF
jgi:hypothetical protein